MQSSKATMFIVSAPSGAGKTSLVRRAIAELDDLAVIGLAHERASAVRATWTGATTTSCRARRSRR